MLNHVVGSQYLRRLFFRAASSSRTREARRVLLASSAALGASVVWYSTNTRIYNDSSTVLKEVPVLKLSTEADAEIEKLSAIVWGSNKSNLIAPTTPSIDTVKLPSVAKWLEGVALRDLAVHERHGACVDACGDIYQWGDLFFNPSSDGKPILTLRGKNITRIQVTESRIFALSSGRLYVLSAEASKQVLPPGKSTHQKNWWWGTSWFGEQSTVDFAEITPAVPLSWGEKIVSISAGRDHLLALTSTGRTFAHPMSKMANSHGQLGFRKFDIPDQSNSRSTSNPRLTIELAPRSVLDPFAKTSPFSRPSLPQANQLHSLDDDDIRFCDRLYEVPALKGVKAVQVAAGGRSSFVRTTTGRVLGWGANEYGQIGLGNNMTLDTINVPTEVVLWRTTPSTTRTKCLNITAGGDLTCFTVERSTDSPPATVDLLLCGNGQWGGLGNNQFSNAQGAPVRAKNISGILEYSEKTNSLQPLVPYAVSVSPTGHVLLTFDTLARSGGGGGRDLIAWGANYDYQLGNGKRGSLCSPTTVHRPDGSRFMLLKKCAREVRDMKGKVWGRRVEVEQCVVAGHGNSLVYWKIC